MQEYWEIYMKNIEGKPASVLFNAGISMDIEKFKYIYTQIAFIKVKLKEPNEKGLLSQSEQTEISFLEDKLESSLIKFRIGKYVGRIFHNGYVTFLYYLQFTYNWQDFLNYALDEHQNYEITSGFQEDNEWNYYYNLLYPNPKEWQIIQNHKVCDVLKAKGDKLKIPRAIEHKAFFENITQKEALISQLESYGFKIQEEIINNNGINGIKFYRVDKPFYYDIDELTLNLIDTLKKYNTSYDGWECSVVKE
jgi:hypothetical protein